jgi:small conductance mechanosensitive channel
MQINIEDAVKQIQRLLNECVTLLPNLILALIVIGMFYGIGRYLNILARKIAEKAHWGKGVGILFGRLGHYATLVFGLLVSLSILVPSFSAKDLVQVLGVGGVAIGFAFKDIFQNFLAGILIIVGRPFKIGDQIQVKTYEGTVEDIEVRATKIRTYDNRMIVIPNTTLFTAEVIVLTEFEKRRTFYDVGIGYGDDIEAAMQIMLDAIADCPEIEHDPAPDVLVVGLNDYNVTLRLRWWTSSRGLAVLKGESAVLPRLKKALTERGIDMPFPTRTILFHDQTEQTDGDRSQQREGWPAGKGAVPGPRVPQIPSSPDDGPRPDAA